MSVLPDECAPKAILAAMQDQSEKDAYVSFKAAAREFKAATEAYAAAGEKYKAALARLSDAAVKP